MGKTRAVVNPDGGVFTNQWRRWRKKVFVAQAGSDRGLGVFAAKKILKDEIVLIFTGPILSRADMISQGVFDHSLCLRPDTYLGPSGGEDDYVNHSCSPNTILRGRRQLVAIRPIQIGEEISVDYETLSGEDDWSMQCFCGSLKCRGVIRSKSNSAKR